jgi:hypothetical protein
MLTLNVQCMMQKVIQKIKGVPLVHGKFEVKKAKEGQAPCLMQN